MAEVFFCIIYSIQILQKILVKQFTIGLKVGAQIVQK